MKKLTYVALVMAISTMAVTTATYAQAEVCGASWYGPGFHGRTMANGSKFNQNDPSHLAHKTLPFGTRVAITNLVNGKQLIAVVTDRGPFVRGRCVDLSRAGAVRLGFISRGHTRVSLRVVK